MAAWNLSQLTDWDAMRRANPLPWVDSETGQRALAGQQPAQQQAIPSVQWQSYAAQNPNGLNWTKTAGGDTDLSKAPTTPPPAASSQGLTQDAPYTWTGTVQSPNAGGALATQPQTPTNVAPDTWERWINESGNLGGQRFVNGRWVGGGPVAVGTAVLGQSGAKTSVAYDANKDTRLYEFNGTANSESNWHYVNRLAADYARNYGLGAQDAYNAALAKLRQNFDERREDWHSSGFDLSNVKPLGADRPTSGQSYAAYVPSAQPQLVNPQTGGAGGTPNPNNWTDTGGKTVPAYDQAPGAGYGQTYPATTQQQQQGGGAVSGDYNNALRTNKVARLATLLQRIGLGTPNAQHSLIGSSLTNEYSKMYDPWLQSIGLAGGNVADHESDLIDRFVGYMKQGGGGMQSIANDAGAGIQAIANGTAGGPGADNPYKSLDAADLMQLIASMNGLKNSTMAPWLQQAFGNSADDAMGQYGLAQAEKYHNNDPRASEYGLLEHLNNDPRYRWIIGR